MVTRIGLFCRLAQAASSRLRSQETVFRAERLHRAEDPAELADLDEMADIVAADLIRISLDLVVALDGRTTGPDRSHKIGQLKAQTKGYDDLRTEFLMRVGQGASDSDIIAWLNTVRAAQLSSSGDLNTQIYTGFLSSLAQKWLPRVERGQKADLARELSTETGDKVFSMTAMLRPGGLQ